MQVWGTILFVVGGLVLFVSLETVSPCVTLFVLELCYVDHAGLELTKI